MKLPDIRGFVNVGKSLVMANRPEILLGTAGASIVGAVVLAARGGYKSGKQIAMIEQECEAAETPTPTNLQIVELTWKNYIPAATVTAAALGSTIGLHLIHVHEKKTLVATGLAVVEEVRESARAYIEDLQDSVDENSTSKTNQKIRDGLMDKQIDRNGGLKTWSDGVITEMYLIRDSRTGRDIWSNQTMIDEALNELNARIVHDGESSLNTFYSNAGFGEIAEGEDYGWNGGVEVALQWSNSNRDDGRPVREFRFRDDPEKGFDRGSR